MDDCPEDAAMCAVKDWEWVRKKKKNNDYFNAGACEYNTHVHVPDVFTILHVATGLIIMIW